MGGSICLLEEVRSQDLGARRQELEAAVLVGARHLADNFCNQRQFWLKCHAQCKGQGRSQVSGSLSLPPILSHSFPPFRLPPFPSPAIAPTIKSMT